MEFTSYVVTDSWRLWGAMHVHHEFVTHEIRSCSAHNIAYRVFDNIFYIPQPLNVTSELHFVNCSAHCSSICTLMQHLSQKCFDLWKLKSAQIEDSGPFKFSEAARLYDAIMFKTCLASRSRTCCHGGVPQKCTTLFLSSGTYHASTSWKLFHTMATEKDFSSVR